MKLANLVWTLWIITAVVFIGSLLAFVLPEVYGHIDPDRSYGSLASTEHPINVTRMVVEYCHGWCLVPLFCAIPAIVASLSAPDRLNGKREGWGTSPSDKWER